MCNHMRQQGIAGNIEWDPQAHVGTALIHQAGEPVVGYMELHQAVARRESHFAQV